ncbi:GntR family transcriptional regulator [Anaerostipes butyraticus]|uniref:GntR family transcriptional regulator n=1 Tax=Anaerostipes butyraticus TaxID=645466 RepID=UPI003207BD81
MPKIKFDQIYETLKDNIINNQYPEHMLPREVELAEEFHCSRNTIHRAIAQLNNEGYVQSIKGRGTVILQSLPIQNDRFFLNLRSYGSIPAITQYHKADVTTSVMSFQEITVDEKLSAVTGFDPGTEVYYIQRLRYLDNKPLLRDVNYFRKDVVTGLNVSIAQSSIYDYITDTLHKKILAARRIVRIKKAEEKDKDYLSLGDYDCVGVIYNYVYISDGTLFEYTESHFVPDNFGFSEFVQY